MHLHGWISGPSFQRSQNDRQWVYINQRMVKDKLIQHAVKQAYEDILHPGRFPACLLYFKIKPSEVDVNVHPTKHEVRFQQPRLVHDFFISTIQTALFHQNIEVKNTHPISALATRPVPRVICEPAAYVIAENNHTSPISKTHWTILNQQYALVFLHKTPYVVDVIATHRHWQNTELKNQVMPLANRPLLVPVRFPIQCNSKKLWLDLQPLLARLGLHIEWINDEFLLIKSVPIAAPYLDLVAFFNACTTIISLTEEQLIHLLCEKQVFNSSLLSTDERLVLENVLIDCLSQDLKRTLLCKPLTESDCRMFLE